MSNYSNRGNDVDLGDGFAYLITETETGYVDGWYMSEDIAARALAGLREAYPWLHYGCFCVFKADIRTLTDDEMINRHYDDIRRDNPRKGKKAPVVQINGDKTDYVAGE